MRWQKDERVTLPLLERLVAEARKATAETLSADGYFSADVQSGSTVKHPSDRGIGVEPARVPRARGLIST